MSRDDVRALVRDAVARHLEARPVPAVQIDARIDAHLGDTGGDRTGAASVDASHPSHVIVQIIDVQVSGADEGRCVIEPAVPCTHCGYCRSYGH